MRTINITFEGENKEIELEKLLYVLRKLENNENLTFENKEQIDELVKKYNLEDEVFLNNINKLW